MAPPSTTNATGSRPRNTKFKPPRQVSGTAREESQGASTSNPVDRRSARVSAASEPPATSQSDATSTIPVALLTRLLHENFEDERTRISKDANEVVAKYMETFVREALARAAYERNNEEGAGANRDRFLEVEDLEKLAPQLLLDF